MAVPEALLRIRLFVSVRAEDVTLVNSALVDETVVARRFVVVTVPKLPFQRRPDEPRDRIESTDGSRLVPT